MRTIISIIFFAVSFSSAIAQCRDGKYFATVNSFTNLTSIYSSKSIQTNKTETLELLQYDYPNFLVMYKNRHMLVHRFYLVKDSCLRKFDTLIINKSLPANNFQIAKVAIDSTLLKVNAKRKVWLFKDDCLLILKNDSVNYKIETVDAMSDSVLIGDVEKTGIIIVDSVDSNEDSEYRNSFFRHNRKLGIKKQWIQDGKIWIGMSKEMAIASIGHPSDINRTVMQSMTQEQWVYAERGIYLYFSNNILSTFQD